MQFRQTAKQTASLRLKNRFEWLVQKKSPDNCAAAALPLEKKVKNTFINLSTRPVTTAETNVLEKGLGYAVSLRKIPKKEIIVAIEDFARRLVAKENTAHRRTPEAPPPIENVDNPRPQPPFRSNHAFFPENTNRKLQELFTEMNSKCRQILKNAKPSPANLCQAERAALKELRRDNSILILPADKGNATVMIGIEEYKNKMASVLNDPAHFEKIASDPTKKWEKQLTSCLREDLLKKDYISKSLYFFLRPSDSRLPQLYGLPKIHKAGAPLRPIVSAIRSFNYNLGKLLVWLLNPYMSDCESYVKNSVDFASFQSKS